MKALKALKAKSPVIARVLLGLIFFAAGVTGLLNLAPAPPDMPENLMTFTNGLLATGYFMTLLKATEAICGLLLLAGLWVPLALVILAPISINIFLVHAFLAPEGLLTALMIGLLMIYLSFFAKPYAGRLKPLFERK
jgi:putative oxidoreductase